MKEAYREERRKYQRENYEKNRDLRKQGVRPVARKATKVYPIKQEDEILAIQRYLLTHGRIALRPRNYLYFVLGISLGRRGGDLAKLKWGDILDAKGDFLEENVAFIREEKTRKIFNLYCNVTARAAVRQYLKMTGITPIPGEFIFRSQITGEDYVSNDQMCCVIKAAAKAVGIQKNIGTHSLRKTFGYRLFKATQNLDLIRVLLNHSDIAETIRYIGLDDDMKVDACEAAAAPVVGDEELVELGLVDYDGVNTSHVEARDMTESNDHRENAESSAYQVSAEGGSHWVSDNNWMKKTSNVIPFPSDILLRANILPFGSASSGKARKCLAPRRTGTLSEIRPNAANSTTVADSFGRIAVR